MKDIVRNLLFLSVLFFSISYDSYTLGVEYDKKYKLYPEPYTIGCIIYLEYYGKRWERLGFSTLTLGVGSTLAILITWRRKKPVLDKKLSILQGVTNECWRYRP